MIKRATGLARREFGAYAGTIRTSSPNARRYLLMEAFQNAAAGLLATVFALYVSSSGMSTSVVGDVEGALALASGVVCLLLPPLVAVTGYRSLLVVAGLAFAVARLGQTLGVTSSMIVVLGLVVGIGDGINRSIGVAFLSENGPNGEGRTRLFTVDFVLRIAAGVVGAALGGIVPTLLAPTMSDTDTLRWAIGLAGALYLVSILPILGVTDGPRVNQRAWGLYARAVRNFHSWDRLARLVVPEALVSFGAGLIMPFVPLFLNVHLGANVAQIGFIQAATSVVMAVATLSTPFLARRLGLVGTIVTTQIASLPFLLVVPLATALPVVAGAMWMRAALMNMSWPIYNQFAVEGIPAADKPLVLGWMSAAWSAAWLAGSVVGGRLAESSYTVGYFITAVLYALAAVMSWFLLRRIRLGAFDAVEGFAAETVEPHA